jgi:hypothetical protein
MSRHGYSDQYDGSQLAMWRGVISSATRGKRGQAFFRSLVAALDAMPEKSLVAGELETQEGAVCALGCLGKARGVDISGVDTEDWGTLGELFDIAPQLAQEVMFINDDGGARADENRWKLVRDWAARQIRIEPSEVVTDKVAGEATGG